MFFGRRDVFLYIQEHLTGRDQNNPLVLYGQRRSGKTSVLYQIIERGLLTDRYVPVFINLQGISQPGMAGVLYGFATEIARVLELPAPSREIFVTDPGGAFKTTFLDSIMAALGKRSLLLLIDEYEVLEERTRAGKLEVDFFPYLRHLMQDYRQLAFVFAGSQRLEDMAPERWSILRNAIYKRISFLEPVETRRLITEPIAGVISYEPAAVDAVFSATSGHPYFTQAYCHCLVARYKNNIQPLTVDDVHARAVIDEVVESTGIVLADNWRESTPEERAVLSAVDIALGRQKLAAVSSLAILLDRAQAKLGRRDLSLALRRLVDRDILMLEEGLQYRFAVDFFRIWISQSIQLDLLLDELDLRAPTSWVERLPEGDRERYDAARQAMLVGDGFQNRGDQTKAIEKYHEAIAVYASLVEAYLGLGKAYQEQNDHVSAMQAYEGALAVDPAYVEAYNAIGRLRRQQGQPSEALEAFEQALRLRPDNAVAASAALELHYQLGLEYFSRDEWRKAVGHLLKVRGADFATVPDLTAKIDKADEQNRKEMAFAEDSLRLISQQGERLARLRRELDNLETQAGVSLPTIDKAVSEIYDRLQGLHALYKRGQVDGFDRDLRQQAFDRRRELEAVQETELPKLEQEIATARENLQQKARLQDLTRRLEAQEAIWRKVEKALQSLEREGVENLEGTTSEARRVQDKIQPLKAFCADAAREPSPTLWSQIENAEQGIGILEALQETELPKIEQEIATTKNYLRQQKAKIQDLGKRLERQETIWRKVEEEIQELWHEGVDQLNRLASEVRQAQAEIQSLNVLCTDITLRPSPSLWQQMENTEQHIEILERQSSVVTAGLEQYRRYRTKAMEQLHRLNNQKEECQWIEKAAGSTAGVSSRCRESVLRRTRDAQTRISSLTETARYAAFTYVERIQSEDLISIERSITDLEKELVQARAELAQEGRYTAARRMHRATPLLPVGLAVLALTLLAIAFIVDWPRVWLPVQATPTTAIIAIRAPLLGNLVMEPRSLRPGETALVSLTGATDPDGGPLIFSWTAERGTLSASATAESVVFYTAPNEPGTDVISVTARNSREDATTVRMEVRIVSPSPTPSPTVTPFSPLTSTPRASASPPPTGTATPSPTLTPTPMPRATSTAPISVPPLGSLAAIVSPKTGTVVPLPFMAKGSVTSKALATGTLWLVALPEGAFSFHPQLPVTASDGSWFGEVWLGDISSKGLRFDLLLVAADADADAVFRDYLRRASNTGSYPGLRALPEGTLQLDRITVIRG